MRNRSSHQFWKSLFAGAIGGLAGSFVMSQFHSLLKPAVSPAPHDGEDSTVKTASVLSRRVFHHELKPEEKQLAGPIVHYAFGSVVGATYALAVERDEWLRGGWGLPFGVAVWLGAHAIAVPALGLAKAVTASQPRQEAMEFGAHLVYGATVEGIRRLIRR